MAWHHSFKMQMQEALGAAGNVHDFFPNLNVAAMPDYCIHSSLILSQISRVLSRKGLL